MTNRKFKKEANHTYPAYDALGNIQRMQSKGYWTRDYFYNTGVNSLKGHTSGVTAYTYDEHGNTLTMPHLSRINWDYANRLQHADLGGGGNAYYVYSASGERVRKVIEKTGGIVEQRIYLGGWEVYRKTISGNLNFERETLRIMDDRKAIAHIETKTVQNGMDVLSHPAIRYQYDNHLGSACLELDQNAAIISYEEYHPFGTTSYRSGRTETEVSLKRYKYVGKERDEGTGLYYYGARYYAGWLARFVSVDPLQFDYPQLTPYNYAGNKPVTHIDIDGMQSSGDMKFEPQIAKKDNTNVVIKVNPIIDNLKPIESNIYQINKSTGVAEKIDMASLDLSKQDKALIKKGGEFIYRNNRLSITSKETINALNNPSEAGPLTEFALGKLKEDFKTYEGHFPESYYENFGKAVIEKSIELNGSDAGVDAASDFLDIRVMSEGSAILHSYESYARSSADTGFDKVSHFAVSASLQYNLGSIITDVQQYGKEVRDEIKSWVSDSPGFDSKDMLANNRGQAFGKALYKKHNSKPIGNEFKRFTK